MLAMLWRLASHGFLRPFIRSKHEFTTRKKEPSMSMQVRVAALKQQLEQLFPGKWLTAGKSQRYVQTGIPEIDNSVTGGVARKRITEWTGPLSSGKTSILRSAVSYWCSRGLNVAYIDTEGKLYPADWAFVEQQWKRVNETVEIGPGTKSFNRERTNQSLNGETTRSRKSMKAGGEQEDRHNRSSNRALSASGVRTADLSERGKFWIVRPPDVSCNKDENQVIPLVSKKHLQVQEAVWSVDQFIRSNAFDVVILDLGGIDLSDRRSRGIGYASSPWRIYARLQRALDRSKAALVIVSDMPDDLEYDREIPAPEPKTESKKGMFGFNKDNSKNNSATTIAAQQNNSANTNSWGCHARFTFNRGAKMHRESGLNGLAMIIPTVKFNAWRDGMSQDLEVSLAASIPNRLFTHSQIPDRRSSKG